MTIELLTHPLILPVILPLLMGLVCLLIPNAAGNLRSLLAVLTSAVVLALVWPLFKQTNLMLDPTPWLSLRVDVLSAFILLAVAFFGLLIAIYSVGYMKGHARHREYFTYLLWTLGVSCGVVLANDLLLLLVGWGFLALTLYLMAGISGPDAAGAARKSLMVIGGTDALMLLGIVIYWQLTGSTRMDGPAIPLDGPLAYAAFLTLLAAAFAKAGAVPFHSWVPDFGEKVDAPVSAFLPASLDKLLGIYLLARCVLDLFVPTPAIYGMLMLLGAVTVISAVLMALVQHDLKRLLSFHAVSQVGYMILGIGTGTAIGLAGGLFHMLNNTIYKSALFLCAGVIEKETGTTDLDRLGGLARLMPVTFLTCTVAALSISGIPPLNGFASKWMIYQGIISSGEGSGPGWVVWLAVAMLGSALTLASFVKVLHATFLCKPSPLVQGKPIQENSTSMLMPMLVLAVLCIVFGVFAFQVPLGLMIFPVVQAEVPGVWWSGLATVLILTATFVGLIVYLLSMRGGRIRRMRTYIGGEQIRDVYISGEQASGQRNVEVTGVDFYNTIEQLPGLQRFYVLTRDRVFDIYEILRHGCNYFVQMLRSIHNGILPAYLRWFVAGLLVVVWVVTETGS
ncbi:MAG: proton-conducting transporter membrane subunit [Xanthomonadales bacterium]|nr:proton-conducting transporter membrane subunit [Xanthomonadales bacterium]